MRFDIVTLFPELFGPHLASGVTRRAWHQTHEDDVVRLTRRHRTSDDTVGCEPCVAGDAR